MNTRKDMASTGLLIAYLTYFLSNILIFFVHGIFWDDWTLFNSKTGILQQFVGNGGIVGGYLHVILHSFQNEVLVYHTLIFCLGLLSIWLLYQIHNAVWGKGSSSIVFCILYACFPLGICHMTQICFPYQIGFTCQLVSVLSFLKAREGSKAVWYFIIACISQFLASLFLNSSIVFWFGVLALAFYVDYIKTEGQVSTRIYHSIKHLPKYFLYFLPCLIYWCLKKVYWMPSGNYAEGAYNELSIVHVLYYPIKLAQSGINTLSYVVELPTLLFHSILYPVLFCVFIGMSYLVFSKHANMFAATTTPQKKEIITKVILGIYLYVIGISAYILVGKVQVFNSLEDRHGIFLPIALVLILSTLIETIRNKRIRICVISVIVPLLIVNSIGQYVTGIKESIKNDYLMAYFSETELQQGNIQLSGLENDELMRFYALSGIYNEATNRQDRCFSLSDDTMYSEESYLTEMYHQKDAKPGPIAEHLQFIENSTPKYLKLVYYLYCDKAVYKEMLNKKFVMHKY